jgi:hypothetical protein
LWIGMIGVILLRVDGTARRRGSLRPRGAA